MSNKSVGTGDPRSRRTRDRLGDALVALVQERAFDDITVQDVLDRAGVSRGTFYNHYRDKDDLFLSDAEEFYERMAGHLDRSGAPAERLAPVEELFAHVREMRRLLEALIESGRWAEHASLARAHFARAIERRMAAHPRGAGIEAGERSGMALALAGMMFTLLESWVLRDGVESAAEMDRRFHRLAWGGINGVGGGGEASNAALESTGRTR